MQEVKKCSFGIATNGITFLKSFMERMGTGRTA
jgi:hypothetical protein